ncbi:MAG TPA: hypothetical protein VL752_18410 [Acidisoma sp.]|uniref:hypothetical protein n=1 Tax=Acidisoma sp. TaxID=1872115 RepID=UPI002B697AFD|nr:hypothetical protein [Acidisoma sp.]HTI02924.1 hypothetical protein [Acidisoma sp.]
MRDGGAGDETLVRGEFFTDGRKFVFRFAGMPLSGIGDTPGAAFDDLMRAEAETAPLSARMRALARDQAGEAVRAQIVRFAAIALILLGIVGGTLAASAVLAPSVITDLGALATAKVIGSMEALTPEREAALRKAVQRLGGIVGVSGKDTGCPSTQAATASPTAP